MEIFGLRLKGLRLEANLSQYELSKLLSLSQSAIAKWELFKTEPTASAIILVANFFNVTSDYLLGLSDVL